MLVSGGSGGILAAKAKGNPTKHLEELKMNESTLTSLLSQLFPGIQFNHHSNRRSEIETRGERAVINDTQYTIIKTGVCVVVGMGCYSYYPSIEVEGVGVAHRLTEEGGLYTAFFRVADVTLEMRFRNTDETQNKRHLQWVRDGKPLYR